MLQPLLWWKKLGMGWNFNRYLFPVDNYGVCSVGSGICDFFLAMVLKLVRDAERFSHKRAVYLKEEWVD